MEKINKRLKEKYDFFSIFGGPHPTFSPEFIEEKGIDTICRGEGFEALPQLVDKLEKGDDIAHIPNLWVKKSGKIYKNSVAHQVKSLDSLPFPDRSLFNKFPVYRYNKTFAFMATLGCPYKCTYCINHLTHKMLREGDRIVRQRSVENVMEEIKQVKEKYPLKYIIFQDELFTLNKNWVKEFSEQYAREIRIPFSCVLRANHISGEIMDDLKKAGVYHATFAIESGNDFLRNKVLKRNMSRDAILRAAKILRDRDITFFTYNLLGIPGETFDMALETWELNVECKPSSVWAFIFFPFPHTELREYAEAKGYLNKEKSKTYLTTYHGRSILELDDKREIENFHKLFPIAVAFPFLINFIKIAVKLPLRGFYNMIRIIWRGYNANMKYFPKSARMSFKEGLANVFDVLFKSRT